MWVWHTPQAPSRTSTSPAFGSARSISWTASGAPNSSRTAALIRIGGPYLEHAGEPQEVGDGHDQLAAGQLDAVRGRPVLPQVGVLVLAQLPDDRLGDDPAAHLAERVAVALDLGLLEHVVPERRGVHERGQ